MDEGSFAWFQARCWSNLPANWFPHDHPIISAVINVISTIGALVYTLLANIGDQGRIATASGIWLDLAAADHLGPAMFPRRAGESDESYRARILHERFRPLVTKAALSSVITDLTGAAPTIFVPATDGAFLDAGCYADFHGSLAGDYNRPGEVYISVQRPYGPGIPVALGFADQAYAGVTMFAADETMLESEIEDPEILTAVGKTLAAGIKGWTLIYSGATAQPSGVGLPIASPDGGGLDGGAGNSGMFYFLGY